MSLIADALDLVGKRRRTRVYDKPTDSALADYFEQYSSPVGAIISKFSSNTPGDGWLLIAGQALSKADYADLYADIGGTFGEDATTFNLPVLTDKYLTGVGALAVGADGGANSVNLSTGQLPAHNHAITDAGHTHTFTGTPHGHSVTDLGHAHTSAEVGGSNAASGGAEDVAISGNTGNSTTGVTVDNGTAGGSNSSEVTGISVNNTGSGDDIDNRPASIAVHYFIKTRV